MCLSLFTVQMQSLQCTVPLLCETKGSGPAESIKGDKYEKVRGSQRACPVQLSCRPTDTKRAKSTYSMEKKMQASTSFLLGRNCLPSGCQYLKVRLQTHQTLPWEGDRFLRSVQTYFCILSQCELEIGKRTQGEIFLHLNFKIRWQWRKIFMKMF